MNYLNRFLQISLDIAEWVDEKADKDKEFYGDQLCHDIGLGCRALTSYLRRGVKEVVELQNKYHRANERANYEKSIQESQGEWLKECFGDKEPYSINDKDKERIKEFVKGIMDEWEKEEV